MIRKRFAFGEDFVFRKTIPKEFEFNKKHEKNYSINVVKMRDMNSEVKEFFDGFIYVWLQVIIRIEIILLD